MPREANSRSRPEGHSLRMFTFVAQPEVLLVWLLFTVFYWVVALLYQPGAMEIVAGVAALIFSIPFVQYGFVIIERSAKGHNILPRMAADIFSMDARTYRILLLSGVFGLLLASLPESYRFYGVVVLLLFSPAILSFVAFHASLVACLNPINLIGFISNMGITYVALRLVGNTVMLVLWYFLQRGEEVFDTPMALLTMAASGCYLTLTMFRGTGGLLHLRHKELGIDTDYSSERAAQAREKWEEKEHRKLAIRLSKSIGRGHHERGARLLKDFFRMNDFADREMLDAELEKIGGKNLSDQFDHERSKVKR